MVMVKIDRLKVWYHDAIVGILSLTPDNRLCAFEYDKNWLAAGFSISPLELPLKSGVFIAKAHPFHGNFGIFEDSLPDGYGRYLLHKALLRKGTNDMDLTALDRLSLVGDDGMGAQEYHYNEIARKCGITVPDFRLTNGKYFTTRRFDIDKTGERIHTATAGGLLCVSSENPILDYSNLLALTGFLCQKARDVEEMYRRMVFNYFTDNKDDHCKNFSFLMKKDTAGKWRWKLAPAYDLTLCTEGYNGEHATSVNGKGFPELADFLAVGAKIKMKENRCREIIEEVRAACRDLLRYHL